MKPIKDMLSNPWFLFPALFIAAFIGGRIHKSTREYVPSVIVNRCGVCIDKFQKMEATGYGRRRASCSYFVVVLRDIETGQVVSLRASDEEYATSTPGNNTCVTECRQRGYWQ